MFALCLLDAEDVTCVPRPHTRQKDDNKHDSIGRRKAEEGTVDMGLDVRSSVRQSKPPTEWWAATPSGTEHVGACIHKWFRGKWYAGTVDSYDPAVNKRHQHWLY